MERKIKTGEESKGEEDRDLSQLRYIMGDQTA